MKYRKSIDGVDRLSILVTLRFSREELEELKPLAKEDGRSSVTKWIRDYAPVAWDRFVDGKWEAYSDDD